MSKDKPDLHKGHFIPYEIRPQFRPDLSKYPPLAPETPKEEIQRAALDALKECQLEPFDRTLPPEVLETAPCRSPDVTGTVLDGEAVLLSLASKDFYTLSRLGTFIWELLTGTHSLENILSRILDRFDITEEVAREDLKKFFMSLRQEGLIVENK